METSLLGNKATFGIEFGAVKQKSAMHYGGCALWLAGSRLQDVETDVCLESVLAGLKGLADAPESAAAPKELPKAACDLLSMMQGHGLPRAEQHYFLAIEGFDDFLKLYFKGERATTFVWAVHPQVAVLNAYASTKHGVNVAVVSNDEIKVVVEQFDRALKEM